MDTLYERAVLVPSDTSNLKDYLLNNSYDQIKWHFLAWFMFGLNEMNNENNKKWNEWNGLSLY